MQCIIWPTENSSCTVLIGVDQTAFSDVPLSEYSQELLGSRPLFEELPGASSVFFSATSSPRGRRATSCAE